MKAVPLLALVTVASLTLIVAQERALAVPLSGNATSIDLTLNLDGLDLMVMPVGTASQDALGHFVLPISGGDVTLGEPLIGRIEHEGSGLSISRGDLTAALTDLAIDFDAGTTSAGVDAGSFSSTIEVFDLSACGVSGCPKLDGSIAITGFGLILRDEAADALGSFFGVEKKLVGGAQFGIARPQLEFATSKGTDVPEPSTAVLIGLGLTSLAFVGRRRRPAAK